MKMASKDDLDNTAAKSDLVKMATKDDLLKVNNDLRNEIVKNREIVVRAHDLILEDIYKRIDKLEDFKKKFASIASA